jgi:hypothetical protein
MSDFDDIDEQEAAADYAAGENTSARPSHNPLSNSKVPDDASSLAPHRIPWGPNDYEGIAHGDSARKLYSSAVAPIVAAARGYKQVHDDGRSAAKKRFQLPDWSTKQGRRLRESLKDAEVLIMPWYTLENVVQGQAAHRDAEFSTIQYRPETPGVHDNGREAKYEFVVGSNSIIGLHPSTPQDWLLTSPTVIIAEGLLKADAAVSAMLIASKNISDDDLLMSPDPDFNHQAHLLALLAKIEHEYRIPVLCIGGVYNWKNNPEWNSIALKGKDVWIAIDGDIATNINVFRAGSQLWSYLQDKKHATTKLLSPAAIVSGDGGEMKKPGIDDYLFEVGPWERLLTQLSDRLPPSPPSDGQDQIGEWRVDEDGLSVSECVAVKDATGNIAGADWEKRVGIGGRIATIAQSRYPTNREDQTGVLGVGVSDTDDDITVEVTVEVQWMDNEGAVQTGKIVGPHTFLNYAPDQWDRHGAKIPHQITKHHEWPPKGRQGQADGWLRAIKQSRLDETVEQVVWQRMGWVPVAADGEGKSIPAFIVGVDVVAYGGGQDTAVSGVGEKQLASASAFGVGKIDDFDQSFNDKAYRASVLADLEAVMAAYVSAKPWTNPGVAGLVLAAAMRPAIPIRPKGSIFVVGPPGKGKSWTAGAFMAFWARRPGDWASDKLPGSAGDTAASIELAMSRAPAWIVDDYHPTTDVRKASNMHDKIADIVRYQFNGVAKRRATNTMGSMSTFPPNAALLITGENELNISSVKQRLISIEMREGALHPDRGVTDDVVSLGESDGAPSRLTQGLIRYMQWRASKITGGWEALIKEVVDTMAGLENQAEAIMENDSGLSKKRSANLFADYAITLHYLSLMAIELGWTEEQAAIFMTGQDGDLGWDAMKIVRSQFHDNREQTPGKSTLRAIRALLNAGKGHILNGDDHAVPPVSESYDKMSLATQLGWSAEADGSMRAKGIMIGYLIHRKSDGAPVLLFDHDNAFIEAAKHYSNLIPAGQTVNSSWRSVQDEKLIDETWTFRNAGGVTARPRIGPRKTLTSGVPVLLSTVLGDAGNDDPSDDETGEPDADEAVTDESNPDFDKQ